MKDWMSHNFLLINAENTGIPLGPKVAKNKLSGQTSCHNLQEEA